MNHNKNESFIQAIRYIYDNIDQPLELKTIALEANTSVSSLKRLFQDSVEQQPGNFIRGLRMEYALGALNQNREAIIEVALAAGFDDHSAFTRCFKKTFGYTPKQSRKIKNIISELDNIELTEPSIGSFPEISLQCVTKTGPYFESAPNAWRELKKYLSNEELSEDFLGAFIGIGHDNPHEGKVSHNEVRFSACITHANREIGITHRTIQTGTYAKFNFRGKPTKSGMAYHYIYGVWAENSLHTIDHKKPAFMMFNHIPDASTVENISIFVPLEGG